MNTKIYYLYRDASNYKMANEEIVAGELTKEQIEEIYNCLDEGINFIPSQVGLSETRFGEITSQDHCWFELEEGAFEKTNQEASISLTAEQLYNNFIEANNNWEVYLLTSGREKEEDEEQQ